MTDSSKYKPILAITMGDPAGIGPEIAVKTLSEKALYEKCSPVLIGHIPTLEKAMQLLRIDTVLNTVENIADADFSGKVINIYPIGKKYNNTVAFGEVSPIAGDIAFEAVITAIELAKDKKVDGTVTGPINKEAINQAGHHYSGHTEIYAHYTNTKKYAMLLADDEFVVIHATTHVSLRQACDLIKKPRIIEVIQLLNNGLQQLGVENPRIGVAGLNPHSGDGGLFGTEDTEEIAPAVVEAKQMGIDVEGPVPADTLFAIAAGGKFDGCVAMYHDQGHIPFKLLGFNWDKEKKVMKTVKGVNITLGLPIIRTSVDHGTAFEIAGKGIASHDALNHAIDYAIKLAN